MGLCKKLENTVFVLIVIGIIVFGAAVINDIFVQYEYRQTLKKATANDISSQGRLAMMYQIGWGGKPKNKELAIEWYEKAAENGSESAAAILCNEFGKCDHGRFISVSTVNK